MRAKYQLNETVLHKDTPAKVVHVFREWDTGPYRYYIEHSGYTWSAPENALLPVKSPKKLSNDIKGL